MVVYIVGSILSVEITDDSDNRTAYMVEFSVLFGMTCFLTWSLIWENEQQLHTLYL